MIGGTSLGELTGSYIDCLHKTLEQISEKKLQQLVDRLIELHKTKSTLYICGNGGSAGNAMHIANDLIYGVAPEGRGFDIEALTANSSVISCLGNDIGYENIFSHQIKVKGKKGDVLLVLSGSGNSDNIIRAIEEAQRQEMETVAILGFSGGKAKKMADLVFHFDVNDMQVSEDTQVILGHILMKALNQALKNESK